MRIGKTMKNIYCCGCKREVQARLTSGEEIYPHRTDLQSLPFWKCDECGNSVGCHYKHKNRKKRTDPVGVIATQEIKSLRISIHRLLDPLWMHGPHTRDKIYKNISEALGVKEFHTGDIKTVGEANKVFNILRELYDRQK